MKKVKKMFSMLIVAAMTCSLLCGITVNAATGYKDDSRIANQEAVAVLSALGLFEGGDDGSFNPNGYLTRAQAAKLIAVLKLGKTAADKLTASSAPFSDVAASHWSAPYVAYCKQQGIISGKSDGKFYPNDSVTGTEWAKMLLIALGYNASKSGLVGSGWATNVWLAATDLGICSFSTYSDKAITRDTAALYLFNAVTAPVVVYDKDGLPSRNAASNAGGYLSGAVNDKFQQYCEKNFPGLKKVYSKDGLTISWQYNGKTIYTTTHTSTAAASGNSITLDPETPIDITGGKVVGTYSEDGRVAIYKGIPYAAPPVGENRWQRPQDVQPWDGVLVADEFGADAWQNRPNMENWWMALYSENMLIEHTVRYNPSEDCLYLNVWAPSGTSNAKKPVIVYFHGGGFGEGAGSIQAYGGTTVAEHDAVYVNINYRLGIFGFYTSEELDAEQGGGSGNYAVMDMAKSLQWVHDNIEKFGGDPNNVTVMGQSAGGMAVSSMIASPLAEGLFQRVFIISGGNVVAGTNDRATAQASLAERNTGNYNLAQLRAMSSEEVVDALGFTAGSFVIDDYVFLEDSATRIMEGRANKCDVMYNSNYGEASAQDVKTYGDLKAAVTSLMSTGGGWGGTPAVPPTEELLALYYKAYPTAAYTSDDDLLTQADIDTYTAAVHDKAAAGYLSTGNLVKKMGDVNMYVAHFSRALPDAQNGMINGSFHTADIPFWLGAFTHEYAKWQGDVPQVNTYNPNERLYYISGLDLELSNRALTYLINFAMNGNPNGVGTTDLPYWYGFDEDNFGYMSLGDKDVGTSITYRALTPAQTALWSSYHASRLDLSEYSK